MIAPLPASPGSLLCKLELWRRPDGRIEARLAWMPPQLVEELPGEPHHKLRAVAGWAETAAASLWNQAAAITPPEGDES